jgi:hypothetical protein
VCQTASGALLQVLQKLLRSCPFELVTDEISIIHDATIVSAAKAEIHERHWGRSLTDVRPVHFSFSLYALPLSGYSRTIPLRDQRIFITHKVGASSFTIGTIKQQVCYLRGITWLQTSLLFLFAVLVRGLIVYPCLKNNSNLPPLDSFLFALDCKPRGKYGNQKLLFYILCTHLIWLLIFVTPSR